MTEDGHSIRRFIGDEPPEETLATNTVISRSSAESSFNTFMKGNIETFIVNKITFKCS